MRICVTGASGYIGRSFLSLLNSLDIDCLGLTRGHAVFPGLYSVDYSKCSSFSKYLQGVDVVVHLAGLAHSPLSHNSHLIYRKANVDPLIAIAYASLEVGVRKLIYVSSIGVLGSSTEGLPFTDFSPTNPQSTYTRTKLQGELVLSQICHNTSMNYNILRPPLVYGPACPGNLASLASFLRKSPIIPFSSLSKPRSFISIEHLIDIILLLSLSNNSTNDTFVVSDGLDLSVSEVVSLLLSGMDKSRYLMFGLPPSLISFGASLFGKSHLFEKFSSELLIDSSRFSRLYNWRPFVDPFTAFEDVGRSFWF